MSTATLSASNQNEARIARTTVLFLGACAALWLTSFHSYLLFHSIVEMTSVAIAAAVFMISWSSRGYAETQPFVLLGIGYLFVSLLDLLHTLSYEGMSVLSPGQDYATKLWIAARGLQALVTLAFVLLVRAGRTARTLPAFLLVGSAAALAVLSIAVWNIFPLCFVEGQGVTLFKKLSEYAISTILIACIVLLARPGGTLSRQERQLLAGAFALNVASELVFTLYVSAYGYQNLIGHLLKLGSFLLAYQALFSTKVRSRLALIDQLQKSTKLLARSEADLRSANLSKDKFFSILAHDLRNPIGGMLAVAELLATRFDSIEPARVREMHAMLYDGARQSAELLECVLQWARAQTGRLQVKPSTIPLAELCEGISALHAPAARGKDISITSHVAAEAVAYADADMVATIVRNLLSNAVKFTPRGGSVVVSSEEDGAWERIAVADSGTGMSEEELSKLFRIDVRFSCPGTESERGTGMGLILCKELVELNKGHIDVQSTRGKGSTFTLTLPRAPVRAPAAPVPLSPRPPA